MAKARFEYKEYKRNRSPKDKNSWRLEIVSTQPAMTLPTMTDGHIFAVARPESQKEYVKSKFFKNHSCLQDLMSKFVVNKNITKLNK